MDIVINEELRGLIPPLKQEELALLEKDILKYGIRDPLVLWGNTLIDGHHRYQIARKHGLEFRTVNIDFPDLPSACEWMKNNQLGRRNLDSASSIELAQAVKHVWEEQAIENLSKGGGDKRSVNAFIQLDKPDIAPVHVQDEIAKAAGVSKGTVARFEQVQKHDEKQTDESAKLIPKIKSGDMTIGGAYMQIKRMNAPKRPDPVADARLEHESFSSKVESGEIVSVQEAKKDNENLAVMAKELSDRINKIQQDIFWIRKEMSMKEFAEMIKHLKDKDGMMRDLDEIIASANRLKMIVEESV